MQVEAAGALGRIGSPAAVGSIKALVSEQENRFILAWALDALGTETARREVQWLSQLATKHDDPEVRGAAALALARAGTPDARGALKDALDKDMRSLDYRTVKAAGEAGDPSYVQRLAEIASGDAAWNLRAVAALGLGG